MPEEVALAGGEALLGGEAVAAAAPALAETAAIAAYVGTAGSIWWISRSWKGVIFYLKFIEHRFVISKIFN